MFFAGISTWKASDKKARFFLALSQISGVVFAFCLLMSAIVPLGVNDSLHSSFSIMLFIFIGCFEIFSASAIRRNFDTKPLFFFGIIAAMVNFAFGVSFNFMNLFIGEWVIIGVFIAYIITLSATSFPRKIIPET